MYPHDLAKVRHAELLAEAARVRLARRATKRAHGKKK